MTCRKLVSVSCQRLPKHWEDVWYEAPVMSPKSFPVRLFGIYRELDLRCGVSNEQRIAPSIHSSNQAIYSMRLWLQADSELHHGFGSVTVWGMPRYLYRPDGSAVLALCESGLQSAR